MKTTVAHIKPVLSLSSGIISMYRFTTAFNNSSYWSKHINELVMNYFINFSDRRRYVALLWQLYWIAIHIKGEGSSITLTLMWRHIYASFLLQFPKHVFAAISILLKERVRRFSAEVKRPELNCVVWRYSWWNDNVNLIIV